MRTPPLLLGATLAFWGWQTGFLVVGLLLGTALEFSRLSRARWDFSSEEFNQLWNITVLLFLGAAAYAFASREGVGAVTGFFGARSFSERSSAMNKAAAMVIVFLQWLPMIFFPFVAAQAWSNRERLDFRTFSWFLRRRAARRKPAAEPGRGLNAAWPYFFVCLLSTSTVNHEHYLFYAGVSVLIAWALWSRRSPRFALPVWAGVVVLAIGLGFVGSFALRNLQKVVQNLHVRWLSNLGVGKFDATESRTAIGQVGRRKGSGKIVLRVETPPGSPMTPLLREATYNLFKSPAWHCAAGQKDFQNLFWETNETSWIFRPSTASNVVIVTSYLDGGRGLLAVPHGLARADHLGVFDLKTNRVATVRVDAGPGLVKYTATYGLDGTFDGGPHATNDLSIAPAEIPALAAVALEMGLHEAPDAEKPQVIARFFARHFTYSLFQEEDPAAASPDARTNTPMARFLLQNRTGHCEYFATATVLLLRLAGIPARYTVGYSVQESAGANRWVVRGRHAHAWCVYYDRARGLWRELDTTPGNWLAMEEEERSAWEPVQDAFSWLWYQFSQLRWGQGNLRQYVFYLLAVVLVIMVIRFVWRKRWRRGGGAAAAAAAFAAQPGADSEFYLVEKYLSQAGLGRRFSEPVFAWLGRIRPNLPLDARELEDLALLHYRLRFDPAGLTAEERSTLRTRAQEWLAKRAKEK